MFPGLKTVFPKVAVMGLFHTRLPLAESLLRAGNGNLSSVLAPGYTSSGPWVPALLAGEDDSLGQPPGCFLIEMGLKYFPFSDQPERTK